jgi:hypothetical protein
MRGGLLQKPVRIAKIDRALKGIRVTSVSTGLALLFTDAWTRFASEPQAD